MSDSTMTKQIKGRFKKGVSGNPGGRPRGARHKATMAAQTLLDGEAQKLTRKAVEMALSGDGLALRLCLERIIPPRKDRPVFLRNVHKLKTGADALAVMAAVMESVGRGDLTPSEGETIGQILNQFGKALEVQDLEERIKRLEGMASDDSGKPTSED